MASDGGCGLWSAMLGYGPVRHWEVQSQIARRRVMVGSRWHWVADGELLPEAAAFLDKNAFLSTRMLAGE